MIRRLVIFALGLGISLSCSFAVFTQTPSAGAAKPGRETLPVYLLTPIEAVKPLPDDGCFGCVAAQSECRAARKPEYLSSKGFGFASLSSRRQTIKDSVAPTEEIRAIDLEGLKKILQRDPKDTRPLLVNFWATWCDPCREEFPDLVKLDADYTAKRLNFVAVSLDDITEIKAAVPQFLKEMKATMPVVLLNVVDPEPAIHAVDATWNGQLPATFLFDRDGKVIFKYFGRIKPEELRSAIDKAVGSKQ